MKLSGSVINFSWTEGHTAIRGHLGSLAESLDGTAVGTLWVADHLLQADPASRPDEPMLEAFRLGTMVTAATPRRLTSQLLGCLTAA